MHSCRVLNISGKFIHGEFSKTEVFWYKQSWVTFSVTSRRGVLTSRRQFSIPLPRRDVNHHVATSRRGISRRDVILVTLSVTSRRGISRRDVIWSPSLSRRDVVPHVTTSIGHALCHVATWDFTSRRGQFCSLSRRDVAPHVAT